MRRGVLGQRVDNIMILRGADMPALWQRIFGEGGKGRFNATYVSPGKVRTAQALAVGLSPDAGAKSGPGVPDHLRDPGRAQLSAATALTAPLVVAGRPAEPIRP